MSSLVPVGTPVRLVDDGALGVVAWHRDDAAGTRVYPYVVQLDDISDENAAGRVYVARRGLEAVDGDGPAATDVASSPAVQDLTSAGDAPRAAGDDVVDRLGLVVVVRDAPSEPVLHELDERPVSCKGAGSVGEDRLALAPRPADGLVGVLPEGGVDHCERGHELGGLLGVGLRDGGDVLGSGRLGLGRAPGACADGADGDEQGGEQDGTAHEGSPEFGDGVAHSVATRGAAAGVKFDGRPPADPVLMFGLVFALVGLCVMTLATTDVGVVVAYAFGALSFGLWFVSVVRTIRGELAARHARRSGGRR